MPALRSLMIARNNLTGCIKNILGEGNCVRLKTLIELGISNCCLGMADMKYLFKVMRRLTNCTLLYVDGNNFAGTVEELFSKDGLPFVKTLNFQETELNKVNIMSLSRAIEQEKLPGLRQLSLNKNNLCGIEEVLEDLFQACITNYKRRLITISISFADVSKPEEFKYKVDSLCAGTMVSLSERQGTIFNWIHDLGFYSMTYSGFHTHPVHVMQRHILPRGTKLVQIRQYLRFYLYFNRNTYSSKNLDKNFAKPLGLKPRPEIHPRSSVQC